MKSTRINDFLKLFVVILAIVSLISVSLTSCGGGGGGGGGGGAASGPADGSSSDGNGSSENAPAAPAPVDSSNADIVSFAFTQADNPVLAADLSGTPQTVNDVSTVNVYYTYGSQQPGDLTALKPVIEVSAGATVSPASGEAQNFTSPVEYTVTAQDGTTKLYTVTVAQRAATQRSITYDLLGGSLNATTPAPELYNVEDGADLPAGGDVTKPNYYFVGWMDQDNMGQIVSSWGPNQRQNDIRLTAHWVKAPYVENDIIYANGIPVTVKNLGGKTMVSFKGENNDEINLCDINRASEYQNLSGYTLFLGKDGNVNASDINVDSGRVTMTGGNLSAIYGYNGDGNNIPVNIRIELKGGTVTDVIGLNKADAAHNPRAEVIVSGNPTIGNKTSCGVHLSSFTDNKVLAEDFGSAQAQAVTLIGANNSLAANTVVAAYRNGTADAGKFYLIDERNHTHHNVNATGNDIVIIGEVSLPSTVTWQGETFTVGEGNVTTDGTIFSVFASGGYFTVTKTTLTGATFDMGIPLKSDNKTENGYVDSLDTSKHYRYIQFKSTSGNIHSSDADSYLSHIVFHRVDSKVTVRINLETVLWDTINAAGVTYFDGSFYKVVNAEPGYSHVAAKHCTWSMAYNKAKEERFNGLPGYLMTITSEAENKFIYDQLFSKKGISPGNAASWLGATRSLNQAGSYDATSWTVDSSKLSKEWYWACGPEAGKKFYTKAKTSEGGVAADKDGGGKWYVSWNSGEPNNSGTEFCAQYCGTYIWNDLNNDGAGNSPYHVYNYVVEFSTYGTHSATKTALHDQKEYTH